MELRQYIINTWYRMETHGIECRYIIWETLLEVGVALTQVHHL